MNEQGYRSGIFIIITINKASQSQQQLLFLFSSIYKRHNLQVSCTNWNSEMFMLVFVIDVSQSASSRLSIIITTQTISVFWVKFLSSQLTLLNRKEGGREGEKEEERRKRKASQRAASSWARAAINIKLLQAKALSYSRTEFPTILLLLLTVMISILFGNQ